MVAGEENAEKPVIVFGALVVWVSGASVASNAYGAGGSVVSVRHVGDGDIFERLYEWGGVGDAPDTVGDSVGGGEIGGGF